METEKEPKTTAATIPRFKKPPTQKEKEYIHRFIESLKSSNHAQNAQCVI